MACNRQPGSALMFVLLRGQSTALWISSTGAQPLWRQGPVSWKTMFSRTGGGGWFGDAPSTVHLLCSLFLFLLHQPHLGSPGIRSRRLGTPICII